jgi:arsenate reductase (thioredoxin)
MPEIEPSSRGGRAAVQGSPALQSPNLHPCRQILFLCPDNSALSIIAQALLNRLEERGFRAFSAGSRPAADIHPLAVDLLRANRIWSQALRPKDWGEFQGQGAPPMDFVISLGSHAPTGLPSNWPGNPRIIHWRISEPRVDGKPTENVSAFRKIFTELETRIKLFVLVNEKKLAKKVAA